MNVFLKNLKVLSVIIIVIMLLVSIASLTATYFILKNTAYLNLQESNNKVAIYYQQTLTTSIGYTYDHIQFAEEFMNTYSIYNSTFDQYIKLSAVNGSTNNFIDSLRIYYNTSYSELSNTEYKMSEQLNKPIFISDISNNGTLIPVSKREWYCPIYYGSPLVNSAVEGVDICKVDIFTELINLLKNNQGIILYTRKRGILRNGTFLDFAKNTAKGFILLTTNIENIVEALIPDTENIKLYKNGICFFSNTKNINYFSVITNNIVVPGKDNLTMTIFFPEKNTEISSFLYILAAVVSVNVVIILIISIFEIQKNRYIVADKMLGYVNHEIRNPLNCIHGLIELSIIELDEENNQKHGELKSNLGTALNACDMLTHIVNDILDIKRINDGKLMMNNVEVNIGDFEKSLKKIITSKLNENPMLTYVFNNEDNISIINCDYNRLLQILLNFLTNAIKFTDNGTILLTLKQLPNDKVKISVSDTGRGIPSNDFKNIFRPFDQANITDSLRHGGVGLGLYLCKMIIEQMNGHIGFESELNKGSVFWIII